MKKITCFIILLFAVLSLSAQQKKLYDFKVQDINGKSFNLKKLKGKKVLIVNVASKCGLTPQYEELEALQKKYGGKKFTVIGFPSNDFKGQEPGTNKEIKEFCSLTYGVTFPMMDKIKVVGDSIHPIYKWLTTKAENGVLDAPVQWNFQKFMIDEKGKVVNFAAPRTSPMSDEIVNWIEGK